MKKSGMVKILGIIGALVLLFVNSFVAVPTAASEPNAASPGGTITTGSKISSLLAMHVKMKQVQANKESQATMKPLGIDSPSAEITFVNTERVFLHFAQKPTDLQIKDLESLGVTVYPDSWIPPVGNHPTGFILANMPVDKLEALTSKSYIISLDTAEQTLSYQNDAARTAMNVEPVWTSGYTGAGVTVAVIDSGIDISNPDFPALDTTNSKDYSNYPAMDDTIANTVTGHGTHVTASLLGRGVQSATYKGVAPEANLVFLKVGKDNGTITTSVVVYAIRDAVDNYHARVINLSLGGWSQYHDGSDQLCQAVDYASSKGATVFAGAGNYANQDWHFFGSVMPNSYVDTYIILQQGTSSYLPLNLVWYDSPGINSSLNLEIINYYDHNPLLVFTSGQTESSRGTQSSLYQLTAPVYGELSFNSYPLRVYNYSSVKQDFHIYYTGGLSSVTFPHPSQCFTLTSPAEADSAIAIGAYVTRKNWTDYQGSSGTYSTATLNQAASYSGQGPRVDGGEKPDLIAPGQGIISVRDKIVYPWPSYNSNADIYPYNNYIIDNDGLNQNGTGPADYLIMSGTSMASPMAAGVGALLLSKNPNLTPSQIKQIPGKHGYT